MGLFWALRKQHCAHRDAAKNTLGIMGLEAMQSFAGQSSAKSPQASMHGKAFGQVSCVNHRLSLPAPSYTRLTFFLPRLLLLPI